jgi:hypothetical protein
LEKEGLFSGQTRLASSQVITTEEQNLQFIEGFTERGMENQKRICTWRVQKKPFRGHWDDFARICINKKPESHDKTRTDKGNG